MVEPTALTRRAAVVKPTAREGRVAVAEPTAREGHAVDGARRARRTSEPTGRAGHAAVAEPTGRTGRGDHASWFGCFLPPLPRRAWRVMSLSLSSVVPLFVQLLLPTPRRGAVRYSAPRHRNDERDNATCYVTMRALEIRIDVTRAMATITIRQSPRPRPRPRRPRPSASATPPAARHKLYHVNRMWRSGRMFLR